MKYIPSPIGSITPIEHTAKLSDEILSQFEMLGTQGEAFGIFSATAETLRAICDPSDEIFSFNLLDVLTIALTRYVNDCLVPHNSVHDKIMSNTKFEELMQTFMRLRENGNSHDQAQLLAWRTFVETAISRLRGPQFPESRIIEFTSTDLPSPVAVEIDDMAMQIVAEMQRILELKRDSAMPSTSVELLIMCASQLTSGKQGMFSRVTAWNEFVSRNIPADARDVLNTELFRVITNGFASNFTKVV